MREKLHIPTVTPEALSNFCETFVECGNNFVTLKNFVDPKLKITECGPVHQVIILDFDPVEFFVMPIES